MSQFPTDKPEPTEQSARDPATGKFRPGNKAARGRRQPAWDQQRAVLREAFMAAMPQKRIKEIADALIALALNGDVPAAKLVLSYALGSPTTLDENQPSKNEECDRLIAQARAELQRCISPGLAAMLDSARSMPGRPAAN